MKRGDIYWCSYEYDYEGEHFKQKRPAIIVSNDAINKSANDYVEVIYLSTKGRKDLQSHVIITSARETSIAKCDGITTVKKPIYQDVSVRVQK